MLAFFLVWTAVASLATAALFVWDKRAAGRDRRRIAEKTLLLWSLAGGWPGGLLAGRWVRHKTQKTSFRVLFALCVVMNLLLAGWLVWDSVR